MSRMAAEVRETLLLLLQVGPPDNPAVAHLVESYRDIARELGQQEDVEWALRSVLSPVRASHANPSPARQSSRRISPSHTSWKAPSR